MAEREFPCSQCGAKLQYTPGTAALKCTHCGHANAIPQSEEDVQERSYEAALATLDGAAPKTESRTVACKSCGATTTLAPNLTADRCPFCGSDIVADAAGAARIQPGALLPFAVTREQARAHFARWARSRWFAPSEFKRYAELDQHVNGLYVPYWTYDTRTTTFYRGERGDDYWVSETYTTRVNGKTVTRTRQVRKTRWHSVSGVVYVAFNDVLVLASKSLPAEYTNKLEPWDLGNLAPYQDEYLSGFRAECYQIGLADGFETAKTIMAPTITSANATSHQ